MNRYQRRASGMTRRDFMKTMAVIGAAAGTTGLLQSCGSSSSTTGQTEVKTLYFDHSHLNPDNHDFYITVGNKHVQLTRTKAQDIVQAKGSNRLLSLIADNFITHIAPEIEFSADSVQLCFIRYVPKGESINSNWKKAGVYLHLPKTSLEKAFAYRSKTKRTYLSAKAVHYKINFTHQTAQDLLFEHTFVGATDTATGIVFACPEVMSFEPDSAAHISENIIKQQATTTTFSQAIQAQGDDWATTKTVKDPTPGSTKTAQITMYSDMTLQFAGAAANDALYNVKQDPTLYVNTTNMTDSSQTKGKIIMIQDGKTYTKADSSKRAKADGFNYVLSDVCKGSGYEIKLNDVTKKGNDIYAKFTCKNQYLRHLGMYVRYLDANNKPIPISSIPSDFFKNYEDCFTLNGYDTTEHKFLKIVDPVHNLSGIPTGEMEEEVEIPMPSMASKMQIFGNTLGHGDDKYDKLSVGITLTVGFDLVIPSIFLCMAAASQFATFKNSIGAKELIEGLEIFGEFLDSIIKAFGYGQYNELLKFVEELGAKLLAYGTYKLVIKLLAAIGLAEVENCIPYVGEILQIVAAAGLVAQLTETSIECANSPWNYVHTLNFTHNISVTINHDPLNPEGFPSVATYYILTATCKLIDSKGNVIDSTTPIQITQQMPSTTRTAPIVVNIDNVPYGGYIALAVGFYSDTGWLAGQATLKDGDNTQNSFSMTITQNQVPLTTSTVYSHKEKMSLDSSGNHVWLATKTPPVATPLGQCGQNPGQLCQIVDITDSNTFASVGYTWQAYSQSSGGQMFYFGNVSTTDTPESSSVTSSPMIGATRIVYDLMGGATQRNFYLDVANGNIIRQIRLSLQGKPTYDAPNSNKAWGKLNFSSDSMLLHPNNKIVSINATLSKIEVLRLPEQPTSDINAPVAAVYSGPGIREGLLNGPLCAALTPKGEILILETANNRIQGFDTGGNPIKIFNGGTSYFAPLKYTTPTYKYLDMAVEYTGYIYLLSYIVQGSSYIYYLDIYKPDGAFLSRTSNFSAAKICVSYWRDVFAGNLEVLRLPNGSLPTSTITEPSISRWIPSTP